MTSMISVPTTLQIRTCGRPPRPGARENLGGAVAIDVGYPDVDAAGEGRVVRAKKPARSTKSP